MLNYEEIHRILIKMYEETRAKYDEETKSLQQAAMEGNVEHVMAAINARLELDAKLETYDEVAVRMTGAELDL